MCPKVLSGFKQIRDLCTVLQTSLQNQMSGKFVQREPSLYIRTDGPKDKKLLGTIFQLKRKRLKTWPRKRKENDRTIIPGQYRANVGHGRCVSEP